MYVDLTDDEWVHLDGKCRLDVQVYVDAAKNRLDAVATYPDLTPERAGFIADVVTEATISGKLIHRGCRAHSCRVCGFHPEPIRFKSGRRKGQFKASSVMSVTELADRFVVMTNYPKLGACSACMEAILPHLIEAVSSVRAELPAKLSSPGRNNYVRYRNRKCTPCGWEGHEGQMHKVPAIMGGSYPGQCPECEVKNNPFGVTNIKIVDGWTVV